MSAARLTAAGLLTLSASCTASMVCSDSPALPAVSGTVFSAQFELVAGTEDAPFAALSAAVGLRAVCVVPDLQALAAPAIGCDDNIVDVCFPPAVIYRDVETILLVPRGARALDIRLNGLPLSFSTSATADKVYIPRAVLSAAFVAAGGLSGTSTVLTVAEPRAQLSIDIPVEEMPVAAPPPRKPPTFGPMGPVLGEPGPLGPLHPGTVFIFIIRLNGVEHPLEALVEIDGALVSATPADTVTIPHDLAPGGHALTVLEPEGRYALAVFTFQID
ncbi:MAG: hypothetical protein LC135_02310 [Phycisphaerae bacterium]|jgi:hypothetical protein|nr:hypothetical protein [Phycisphaerae bacterium]MCZ2398686.1 hypothetical protein [Phycisphaerae bacterium]NUQ50597.1 hypothetical protein [Phycisphaerae bacterium]